MKYQGVAVLSRDPFFDVCYHVATIYFKNGVFQTAGSLLIGVFQKVGVDVQGHHRGRVTKLILDVFDVLPVLH